MVSTENNVQSKAKKIFWANLFDSAIITWFILKVNKYMTKNGCFITCSEWIIHPSIYPFSRCIEHNLTVKMMKRKKEQWFRFRIFPLGSYFPIYSPFIQLYYYLHSYIHIFSYSIFSLSHVKHCLNEMFDHFNKIIIFLSYSFHFHFIFIYFCLPLLLSLVSLLTLTKI